MSQPFLFTIANKINLTAKREMQFINERVHLKNNKKEKEIIKNMVFFMFSYSSKIVCYTKPAM